jgi:hypothetical protein
MSISGKAAKANKECISPMKGKKCKKESIDKRQKSRIENGFFYEGETNPRYKSLNIEFILNLGIIVFGLVISYFILTL